MTGLTTDTVITREVAWLSTVDSLPSLLVANGGPFDTIAAYWPKQPGNGRAIYVTRNEFSGIELSQGQLMPRHAIRLRVWWSIIADYVTEQTALDVALEALVRRVNGAQFDRSHGSRFLSAAVASSPGGQAWRVSLTDPERADGQFRADLTYTVDDFEANA